MSYYGNRAPDYINPTPRNPAAEKELYDAFYHQRNLIDTRTGLLRKIQRGLDFGVLRPPQVRPLPGGVGGFLDDGMPVINARSTPMERMGVSVHEYRHRFDKLDDDLYHNDPAYRIRMEMRAALEERAFLMKNKHLWSQNGGKPLEGLRPGHINHFANDIFKSYGTESMQSLSTAAKTRILLNTMREMGLRPKADLFFYLRGN